MNYRPWCAAFLFLFASNTAFAETIAPGQTGEDLRAFLRANFRPTQQLTYKSSRKKMFSSIDNVSGKVRCVYTGKLLATDDIPDGNVMNTEHTWPQSKFDKRLPMRADLHHLFPTLNPPNGERANHPFAEIPDNLTETFWRSEEPEEETPPAGEIDEYSESDGERFEPREDHQGNVARAMFYFWVIYENDDIEPGFIDPQLSTLKAWHEGDPVDTVEQDRNNAIQAFQGNANPFVLDPSLVERVLADTPLPFAPSVSPERIAARAAPDEIPFRAPVSVRLVSWNMQSNFKDDEQESDPEFLKAQMAAKEGVDIWALSEVLNAETLSLFEEGAEDGEGTNFYKVMSRTGGRDRLALLYDSERFTQIGAAYELTEETWLSNGLRASLVVHLKGNKTGQEFLVMVNHLMRGEEDVRLEQAMNLNSWARRQTLPVVACGDFNFDYDIDLGDLGVPNRDGGFDALVEGGTFEWVRPRRLVKSQASDRYNTLLDFVFVANAPFRWTGYSNILEREADEIAVTEDFDDDDENSDHRPVEAVFMLDPGSAPIR